MAETLFNEEFLKKIELLFLVSKKIAAGSAQAMRRSKKLGSGIEVADYRAYIAGDELRHIDWNYYASTREMLIRLFEEEEDLHIYFLVDMSPSMRIGDGAKLLYARKVAAALGYIGLSNLDRVSIVPFAESLLGYLPPSRGRGQIWKLFRFLEEERDAGQTSMGDSLRQFVAQTRRRGLVVLISDFYDPDGFVEAVNLLRYRRFEPLIVQLVDEREFAPNLKGDVEVVDCETGSRVRVTVTPKMLQRYREAQDEMIEEVASFAKQKNLLHFRASVQEPFDDLVLRVFRAGGFLR